MKIICDGDTVTIKMTRKQALVLSDILRDIGGGADLHRPYMLNLADRIHNHAKENDQ